ncbi:DEKNAAC103161 [Brettanomyces naardenensis]|uniref:DEKNAAC103161 n=1 Tax=Brettanomyces naardenensis TaxID=13370 RepID=A0A448YMH0_BRENA|nr:DEKNAAC103161 [Brettanomyces naardenensis]
MSFLDPASCAGNNAINKFNARANLDTSLNNQLQSNGSSSQKQQGTSFNKLNRVNPTLQNEFNRFGREESFNESVNSFGQQGQQSRLGPQGRLAYQGQVAQQGQFAPQGQPAQQAHGQQRWISDFQNLNINDQQRQQMMNQPGKASQWSMEFNSMEQSQIRAQNSDNFQIEASRIRSQISSIPQPSLGLGYGGMYRQNNENQVNQVNQVNRETSQPDFDSAFNEVEQQLRETPVEETKKGDAPMMENDKIKFAEIAQSVFNTMNSSTGNVSKETNDKFKQSKFLDLMGRISKREVEINDQNDKFVDSQGHDIRDDLADPLKDLREEDLRGMGPFESAKVVHEKIGDHLTSSAWETTL